MKTNFSTYSKNNDNNNISVVIKTASRGYVSKPWSAELSCSQFNKNKEANEEKKLICAKFQTSPRTTTPPPIPSLLPSLLTLRHHSPHVGTHNNPTPNSKSLHRWPWILPPLDRFLKAARDRTPLKSPLRNPTPLAVYSPPTCGPLMTHTDP